MQTNHSNNIMVDNLNNVSNFLKPNNLLLNHSGSLFNHQTWNQQNSSLQHQSQQQYIQHFPSMTSSYSIANVHTSQNNIPARQVNEEIEENEADMENVNNVSTDEQSIVKQAAPIIVFKLDQQLLVDRKLLESEVKKATEGENIKIRELKLTENGNVLIFPQSQSDRKKIMESINLFPYNKKLDLESEKKKFVLLVKGIKGDEFLEIYDGSDLDYGIAEVLEIKNKEGRILNMCKITINTKEEKDKLVKDGFIQIGLFKYVVENIVRAPRRCHNCKKFGHSTLNCKEHENCASCGAQHKSSECKATVKTCLNCGENHSCYYKGCKVYKDLFKKEVEKSKQSVPRKIQLASSYNKSGVPEGFTRHYSDAVSTTNNITQLIDEKFNTLSKQLCSQLTQFTLQFTKNMNDIKESLEMSISKSILDNNSRYCHFIIDLIKILVPTLNKPDTNAINSINNRLDYHKLGNIKTKNFSEYLNKLWK